MRQFQDGDRISCLLLKSKSGDSVALELLDNHRQSVNWPNHNTSELFLPLDRRDFYDISIAPILNFMVKLHGFTVKLSNYCGDKMLFVLKKI